MSPPRPERLTLDYTFAPSAALDLMSVRICSRGRWPEALVPIHDDGAQRLRAASLEVGGVRTPLEATARIETRELARDACVRLEIDLSARSATPAGAARTARAVFAPTSAWLWTPVPRPPDFVATGRFELPPGVARTPLFRDAPGVEDPAAHGEGELVLDDDAFHFVSYAGFGTLERDVVTGAGACLELSTLGGGIDSTTRRAWLGSALGALAHLGPGALPPRASLVLVPVPREPIPGSPVFGLAAHGSLPTVLLAAPIGITSEILEGDWALVHELVHLATPHVSGSGAWLTEGLATYYQEVLRARAGRISAGDAWRALDEGFRRGLSSGGTGTLREASADMHASFEYGRVYWSGAAVALLADLALRRRGSSLDEAMARAARERRRETSDAELARILDGERGTIVADLVERWGSSIEPPDLATAYEELGLSRAADGLALSPTGEALRAAIVNPRALEPSEMVDCAPASGVSSGPPL